MPPDRVEEKHLLPADLGKERCAIALRKALAASGRFRTVRELAAASGIKYETLKGYFRGRRLPNPETWNRLLSVLEHEIPTVEPRLGPPAPSTSLSHRLTAEDRAAAVGRLMQNLSQELEFFKRGSRADRDVIRTAIPGRDVGYLTSLLRALYDEDQFEAWILFSEYSLGRKTEER